MGAGVGAVGNVLIDGEDISQLDEQDLIPIRKNIGMIFQEGALFDSLSVYDNVAYRLHEESVDEAEVEHEVRRMLNFVNLEDAIDKMPAELSGGMRRRVGIARALVVSPKTARHHVSAVLAKLGLASRREVQAAVTRLGFTAI